MAKNLIIVESPTKANTLKKLLTSGYEITASNGHVIDLPKSKLGVDIENNFTPQYITIKGKGEILKKIKELYRGADKVFLASDPDREGESIAWHIANALGVAEQPVRIEFHEITKASVLKALKEPHNIDLGKVNAQQARRLLDRLVGYQISPLLWKVLGYNTSAGRVQSVALKLICDLEDEIIAFVPEKYWDILGIFENELELKLYKIAEEKVERVKSQEIADKIKKEAEGKKFTITKFNITKKSQRAPLPFKTSTLQQLASSYLSFSPSRTMKIAQSLYEGMNIDGKTLGLITYMRTDSTRVSSEAKKMAQDYINDKYGKQYVGNYINPKSKNKIQDAHEAIRPTSMDYEPEKIKANLSGEQYRLYKLIFERFLVSQFTNLEYDQLELVTSYNDYSFRGTFNKITFDGYYKILEEDKERFYKVFPNLNLGDTLKLEKLNITEGITKPPVRYTEASLIKELETEGIGRPSTYATIVETLKKRNYVEIKERKFWPTELGQGVKGVLEENFPNIMNVKFTSNMEDYLDDIEEGKKDWHEVLKSFYLELSKYLTKFDKTVEETKNKTVYADVNCEKCGKRMLLKGGRFGKYLECENSEVCKNKISIPHKLINYEELKSGLVTIKEELSKLENQKKNITTDLKCDKCGSVMLIKVGKFGRYLACSQCENKMRIPKEIKIEELIANLKGEEALVISDQVKAIEAKQKELLKDVGPCEKCGNSMVIKYGKWGPFFACSNYPECKNIRAFKPKTDTADSGKTKKSTASANSAAVKPVKIKEKTTSKSKDTVAKKSKVKASTTTKKIKEKV